MRKDVSALFYLNREGCSWRALSHDLGIPCKTAYNYFRVRITNGTWDRMVDGLIAASDRLKVNLGESPDAVRRRFD